MPRKPTRKTVVKSKGPSYFEMIEEAIVTLNDRTGCSQPAIEKYITSTWKRLNFKRHYLRAAIKRGIEKGTLLVHHNHKNSYKLPPKTKKAAPSTKKTTKKKKARF
jgi:hypothetical protein